MTFIAVCRSGPAPSGERHNEGTSLSPMLAAQHPYLPERVTARSFFPRRSSGIGDRQSGPFDNRNLELVKSGRRLNFNGALKALRSLIPGLRRAIKSFHQLAHRVADPFQVLSLSAGSAGLVGCFDRHEATKEKFPHDGKAGTRPRNLTARKRNAR